MQSTWPVVQGNFRKQRQENSMSDLETLKIKLGLKPTYWNDIPEFCVSFNNKVLTQGTVTVPSGEVEFLEFEVTNDGDTGVLSVELMNKDYKRNTVKSESGEDYTIVKDLLLDIEHLYVDDIDLGNIVYTTSEYRPDYPDHYQSDNRLAVITGTKTLGWNGTWSIAWGNPFYIWLLENL
jgi:hypothetical protein